MKQLLNKTINNCKFKLKSMDWWDWLIDGEYVMQYFRDYPLPTMELPWQTQTTHLKPYNRFEIETQNSNSTKSKNLQLDDDRLLDQWQCYNSVSVHVYKLVRGLYIRSCSLHFFGNFVNTLTNNASRKLKSKRPDAVKCHNSKSPSHLARKNATTAQTNGKKKLEAAAPLLSVGVTSTVLSNL